jgi:hypothetical protein
MEAVVRITLEGDEYVQVSAVKEDNDGTKRRETEDAKASERLTETMVATDQASLCLVGVLIFL